MKTYMNERSRSFYQTATEKFATNDKDYAQSLCDSFNMGSDYETAVVREIDTIMYLLEN
jgi:hypothetical protein